MTREEANKVLKNLYNEMTSEFDALTDEEKEAFSMAFKALSTVRKGKWKDVEHDEVECSECGHREKSERFIFEDLNFCSGCGADNRGEI